MGAPLVELDVEQFSLPIKAYTTAYFLTARLAARRMVANKSGAIMTVTALPSRTGTVPPPSPGRVPPGTLDLSIHRRGAVIELGLSGELDIATALRLGEAMAWLRISSGPATTFVIDTSDVAFIAAQATGLCRPRSWAPMVSGTPASPSSWDRPPPGWRPRSPPPRPLAPPAGREWQVDERCTHGGFECRR